MNTFKSDGFWKRAFRLHESAVLEVRGPTFGPGCQKNEIEKTMWICTVCWWNSGRFWEALWAPESIGNRSKTGTEVGIRFEGQKLAATRIVCVLQSRTWAQVQILRILFMKIDPSPPSGRGAGGRGGGPGDLS